MIREDFLVHADETTFKMTKQASRVESEPIVVRAKRRQAAVVEFGLAENRPHLRLLSLEDPDRAREAEVGAGSAEEVLNEPNAPAAG